MTRCVAADSKGVCLHQAGNATSTGTILTVSVGYAEPPPVASTVATAAGVFVRTSEDMSTLMRENPVNVVGTPAIVVILHHQSGSTDAGVCEMSERIFGEESAVCPSRSKPISNVLYVCGYPCPVRAEAKQGHRRVAP